MSQNEICWSCKGPLKEKSFFCDTCGSVQKPFAISPFELFGVPETFSQNLKEVEKKYLELQQQFHPDKFIHQSISVQMFALSWGGQVNDVYSMLTNHIQLSVKVLEVNGSNDVLSTKPSASLMMQQFELRERLDEQDDFNMFLNEVQSMQKVCVSHLKQAHENANLEDAKNLTIELQFLTKFTMDIKRKIRQKKLA